MSVSAKTSPNQREPRQIGPSLEGPIFLSRQSLYSSYLAHSIYGGVDTNKLFEQTA